MAIKVLDWSESSFASGAAPTLADFEARPESNPDLDRIYVVVRSDGLYVNYTTVRFPQPAMLILR